MYEDIKGSPRYSLRQKESSTNDRFRGETSSNENEVAAWLDF